MEVVAQVIIFYKFTMDFCIDLEAIETLIENLKADMRERFVR